MKPEEGLDASMLEYLCGISQDIYAPDAFTTEVQRYLDQMEGEDYAKPQISVDAETERSLGVG
jgi:hypothetical protein